MDSTAAKAAEFLSAGVSVACVVDPDSRSVQVFRDDSQQKLQGDDELTLPDVLPGFSVPVRRFFE
jgi:Uma2 family endonuclease